MSKKRPRFGETPSHGRDGDLPPQELSEKTEVRSRDDVRGDPFEPTNQFGAPLPLVTQPMIAVGPNGLPITSTNIHAALTQQLSPRQLAHTMSHEGDRPAERPVRQGAPTVEIDKQALAPEIARTVGVSRGREVVPHLASRQPPEIGLTQHHLPDDAPHDQRLVLVDDRDSERAASYRVLRHHLLEAGRPQVIVVSSPQPGDGKTTVAVNLALALSECGRSKVLLVEGHVRRPQLASLFRFVPPWCFAEQLAAHRHQPLLPWGFVDIPGLWLHVAAINPRLEQAQLLDAPAFAIAMERLRLGGYDHIVIDAPPVMGSADVNLIQDAADGTLLVIRGKRTTARDLRDAVEQLSPSRVLGTVLMET